MKRKGEILKPFVIPFIGLKLGKHDYQFEITETFFEAFEDDAVSSTSEPIEEASIELSVQLDKKPEMLTLDFSFSGQVFVNCDRCLDRMSLSVESQDRILIKFGEQTFDETDEIVVLPESTFQINLAQFAYELLILALPIRRVHPDGECDPEMVQHLQVQEEEEEDIEAEEPPTDPRWAALANLKNKNQP